VARTLNDLAVLYHDQELYPQAEPLYQRALTIREKISGPDDPTVASVLNDLAELYHDQELYSQAEPLYRRALAIREKTLGPENPDVATSLNNLRNCIRIRAVRRSGTALYPSVGNRGKGPGPDHPEVATTLKNLAKLYRKTDAKRKRNPRNPSRRHSEPAAATRPIALKRGWKNKKAQALYPLLKNLHDDAVSGLSSPVRDF
jgi:tetratricopeptide (TPR) repeat protein